MPAWEIRRAGVEVSLRRDGEGLTLCFGTPEEHQCADVTASELAAVSYGIPLTLRASKSRCTASRHGEAVTFEIREGRGGLRACAVPLTEYLRALENVVQLDPKSGYLA